MEASVAPLVALLKRCRKQTTPATDYSSQLADLFGVQSNRSFPSAALALLGYGNDPADACWIHADPVNLQADMDRAILSDSQTLQIRPDEAEQLVTELMAYFAVDGLSVVMVDENNWFIRLSDSAPGDDTAEPGRWQKHQSVVTEWQRGQRSGNRYSMR